MDRSDTGSMLKFVTKGDSGTASAADTEEAPSDAGPSSSTTTDQLKVEMPPVKQDNNGVNRCRRLFSFLNFGVPPVISIFCIGLVSGAAGGLLLGATAVVLLQSVELLDRTLSDHLEKIMNETNHFFNASNEQVHYNQISVFAVTHGVLSSILSVAVGLFIGFSTNSLSEREQIERKGEAESGKALAVAGPVCLMVVTAAGCLQGLAFESFLSITPFAAFDTFMMGSMLRKRLCLVTIFVPVTAVVNLLQKSHSLKLHTITVRLMLIISDVYNIRGQRIVALQSPTSTDTSSVVVEAIFVGVLASLMWTVTVGMSLFVAWQRGGAGKICATAAATGSAVLGVIKLGLPVLGPGPTIGALIGVAGAAGISLAAAAAATDQYRPVVRKYGWFGRLGVTVGAAVGAFFMSCAHSGLSAMFMALCAATIPPGAFLLLFVHSTSLSKECLYLHLVPVAVILFTYAGLFYVMSSSIHGGMSVFFIINLFLIFLWDDFWAFVNRFCLRSKQKHICPA